MKKGGQMPGARCQVLDASARCQVLHASARCQCQMSDARYCVMKARSWGQTLTWAAARLHTPASIYARSLHPHARAEMCADAEIRNCFRRAPGPFDV